MSSSAVTSTARGIGLSNRTVGGRASAIGIYDKWKSVLDESWETKKTELESYRRLSDGAEQMGDLIKLELTGLSIWLVNEDIKQRNNADKDLGRTSLMQYFSQIKEVMKDAFPDLPIWINHDEPGQWYNILRTSTIPVSCGGFSNPMTICWASRFGPWFGAFDLTCVAFVSALRQEIGREHGRMPREGI